MKPSLLPLFASLLSATSLLAQDPGHQPTAPEPTQPPQPPQPPPHLSGPGERGPHQQALPPADAPRPQQRRRPNIPQPAPAISPRAIANIEQMARAKEAEGHPDEAMELRQLIGSLRSPQGQRPNLRPQPSQPFPAVPNAHGMTTPARPNADVHQQLQSLQRQLMALRNELNALRHQPAQPPAPHAAPLHSPDTLKRIAKARLEALHGPLADKGGSIQDQIKSAIRDLLEKRLSDPGKPKKLKELRKDSPDVKKQRKSKEKPESKDAPKQDAPKEPEADSHKKDADHHEGDHAEHKASDDHKEAPKDAEPKHDAAADHDDDDHEDADDHDEDEADDDDHKEEHKGGEKEEPKEG